MLNENHLIIGTMKWGSWGSNFSEIQATDFLIRCYELGYKHFDLASIYGNYQTEKLFGKALKNSKIPRKEIFITTKFGIEYPCENSSYQVKAYNSSKEHFNYSLEKSLNDIEVDYLDQYLIHRPDYLLNIDELKENIHQARLANKIIHFGVSNFSKNQVEILDKKINISSNQIQFSVSHLDALFLEELLYFQANKIPLSFWSPLGNYFNTQSEENDRLRIILKQLEQKYQLNEGQLLILFCKKLPNIVQPILGTTTIERLKEFKTGFLFDLEREDWYKILEAVRGKKID